MKKNNKKKSHLKAMLAAFLCLAALAGCGAGVSPDRPGHCYSDDVKPVAEAPAESAVEDPDTHSADPGQAGKPGEKPGTEKAKASEAPEKPEPEEPEMDSVEGVARLGDLLGLYQMDLLRVSKGSLVLVDTESGHNPYDLTWRYGPQVNSLKRCMDDPEWDALYRSYVDACDWSLVFDADWYKNAFPMLAKLYHDDDALLLEHFQTQGVHEGRQASAGFNVSAYMENCGSDLTEAFGDDYECYYFYYMLNQDSEKAVDAGNAGDKYPLWLTVELSLQQSTEHVQVNSYRKEDGVGPVEVHPELVALANYRAWYDAEHNLYGHDWCKLDETSADMADCFARISLPTWSENTNKWYHTSLKARFDGFYVNYRLSESHNEAMTRDTQRWSGYSNPYVSNNPGNTGKGDEETGYCAQFDVYSGTAPVSPRDLY